MRAIQMVVGLVLLAGLAGPLRGGEAELVIRGDMYHRVRIPCGAKEMNIVAAGEAWKDGIIPVRGHVQVEAWVSRNGDSIDEKKQADIQCAGDDNGTFALSIPDPTGLKLICLRLTYSNAQVRLLKECTTFELGADGIARALAAGEKAVPLDRVKRTTRCWLRWEEKPREFALGEESAIPSAHRSGNKTVVEFAKANGFFVNSFILQAPYVNQSTHPIKLAHVKAPAKQILELLAKNTPAADLPAAEMAVRKRLGLTAGQAVPDESTTEVAIGGGTVCFPASAAMALGSLGVFDDSGKGIQQVGQGCYDYFYRVNKEQKPGEFPYQAPRFGSRSWPFSENGDKQWLTTRPQGGYHPWQVASPAEPNLPGYAKHEFKIPTSLRDSTNVFTDRPERDLDVLQNLGRGNPALVSITHRRYNDGGQGGHLLCLVGTVIDNQGHVVRLIVHDPFGDQSQHPTIEGYYDGKNHTGPNVAPDDKSLFDKDGEGIKGAYCPYGGDINSYRGKMESRYMLWFLNPKARQGDEASDKPAAAVESIRGRLLASEAPTK